MRILITGGGGFVARYLADKLKEQDVLLSDAKEDRDRKVVELDITKSGKVEALIKKFHPEQVYHLAAITNPRFASAETIHEVNVKGSENLLLSCRKHAPHARILLVSSGYVYGECKEPAEENSPTHPIGPYAKSKIEMETLALKKFSDLDFVIARPFNHSGRGQQLGLVLPDLANQIKRFKQKEISQIHTFNLNDSRDFLHVKDVVRGYIILMDKGKSREIYNISSGKSVKIKEILRAMIEKSGLKNAKINEREKIGGLSKLVGSSRKIIRLGWEPKYSLDKIISDFI